MGGSHSEVDVSMVLRRNVQQVNPHCLNAKCPAVLRFLSHLHVTGRRKA